MPAAPRTFVVRKPELKGEDIREFQHDLNHRFATWNINKRIVEDRAYGTETEKAAREVCIGLGILPGTAMKNGVTPALRIKLRHIEERTPSEIARSTGDAAKRMRAKLRKENKTVGHVIIAPGANSQGRAIQKPVLEYVGRMSDRLGQDITITCGTNHDKFTVDGNISDHFAGMAADIGMAANNGTNDGPVGDAIMTAALIEAGVPPTEAAKQAKAGGLFNEFPAGMRVQCIWKTDVGGNHHNHVHVGLKPI